MLKKLLRYDLQSIFKFLVIFYSLGLFFAVLTRIFFSFENSLALNIIGQVCSGATVSMMCSTLINNLMRMWIRFKNQFYGDESYLVHTIPVEKRTHYFSKISAAVITLFTSLAVIALTLFIAYYSKENLSLVKGLLEPLAAAYDSTVVKVLSAVLFVLFLEFLNILQCGYTGIILGHKMNNAKNGFSVLYGFITFLQSQSIVVVLMLIVAVFNENFMNLFVTKSIVDISTVKTVICLGIAAYTVIAVLFCLLNVKLLKKGVDVD